MGKDTISNYESGERLTPQGLHGVVVPLITPLEKRQDKLFVDQESLGTLTRFVIQSGVDILFPAGNAGDGRLLTTDDYNLVLQKAVETRNIHAPNVPVVAGVLRDNIADIVIFSKIAETAKVNALVLAPLYGTGDPLTKVKYILETTKLPVILYDNPDFTNGVSLTPDFVQQIIDLGQGRVIGIKVSSKDPAIFLGMMKLKSNFFKVLQGTTAFAANSLKHGADGIVPVEANILPGLFSQLYQEFRRPNKGDYKAINLRLQELLKTNANNKQITGKTTMELIKDALTKGGVIKFSYTYPKP